MTLRRTVRCLLLVVLGLPLVQATLAWVVRLLAAMGDQAAANVIGHLNTAVGVLWLVALVGLVVALAVQSLEPPRNRDP
jgi:hypothetical protein